MIDVLGACFPEGVSSATEILTHYASIKVELSTFHSFHPTQSIIEAFQNLWYIEMSRIYQQNGVGSFVM